MKALAGLTIKFVFQWIKTTAIKIAKKAFLIAIIAFGLGLVGLLPRSPFSILNSAISSEHAQASSFLRYIPVFIPVHEMLSFLLVWFVAVGAWYGIRILLSATKVII